MMRASATGKGSLFETEPERRNSFPATTEVLIPERSTCTPLCSGTQRRGIFILVGAVVVAEEGVGKKRVKMRTGTEISAENVRVDNPDFFIMNTI
jgi:hypothetical protein